MRQNVVLADSAAPADSSFVMSGKAGDFILSSEAKPGHIDNEYGNN